ncbi:PAAR domain-containing protein [Leptolyngbya ohadii]|uniref:PAAR domain-containing protein n=1 Tax=Leptolyngbya ohadii TaxID=1962290 RepID=UPI000B59A82E|nr:PAAR domain-containing protein [Leptolyngbya ohadii]
MPRVARIGDTISHGGNIIGGSPDCYCNGQQVGRLGDPVLCFAHGVQAISSASSTTFANGIGVARLGDSITCGAVISSASPDVWVDG